MTTVSQCRHCTVPLDSGDTCKFCKSYVPPEQPRTWRDVADQLTPEQIAYLGHWAANPIPRADGAVVDDAAHQDALLYAAQKCIESNAAAARLAHIAPPPDAEQMFPWTDEYDGTWQRTFIGMTREAGGGKVRIIGYQDSGGTAVRMINIDVREDLDAATARQLATVLVEAARELDRLR